MYIIETTKKTTETIKGGTKTTTITTTTSADNLMEGYMMMLEAFNEGQVRGTLTDADTGELHMTFIREDDNAGVELMQWLSNELMEHMTKGRSICCIPEDVAEEYEEVDCSIWEEDDDEEWVQDSFFDFEDEDEEDKVILSKYALCSLREIKQLKGNY